MPSRTCSISFGRLSDFGEEAWNWIESSPHYSAAAHEDFTASLQELLGAAPAPGNQLATALDKLMELVKSQQWLQVSKATLIHSARLSGKFNRTSLAPGQREALDLIADRAADGLRSQLKWQNQAVFQLLTAYARHYREVCHEQHVAFFSDITDALRNFPHRFETLGYRLDGQIDHLLLDEFQDTSADQWRVLECFAQRIFEHGAGTFFCVGDVKQAIYAWRHGSSEILQGLAKRLPSRAMNETRRSHPAVVELINQVFLNLNRHSLCDGGDQDAEVTDRARADAIASWVADFPPHGCHHAGLARQEDGRAIEGYACLRSAAEPEKGETPSTATQKYVANLVAQMWAASPQHGIGILVRTNDCVTQIIHQLRQHGIHASEIGGNPLTNSAPARLILSLLRFADHPGHSAAAYHVTSSPLGSALGFSACPTGYSPQLADYARQLCHDLLRRGYGATIADLTNQLAAHCTAQQRRRLRQLVDLAYLFQPRATPRPEDFVEFVEATRVADPTTANVQVLTIHQSKGLEYDRVVVTEIDRLFPTPSYCYERDPLTYSPRRIVGYVNRNAQRLLDDELTELYHADQCRSFREELCNLYVALTRARFELQIVVQPVKSARKFPSTLAGLVRAALADSPPDSFSLPPETTLASKGNPDWHRALAPASVAERDVVRARPLTVDAIRFRVGPSLAAATSPSDLEGGSIISLAESFSEPREASRQHGTLMHGWLEAIQWLGDELPSAEWLQRVATQLGIAVSETEQRAFLRTLQQPKVQQVLRYERYQSEAGAWLESIVAQDRIRLLQLEVRNEQPILYSGSARVLSGFVDRLVLVWSDDQVIAADVMDFKTDQVDSPQALPARYQFYAPQLTAYREAVAGMLRIPLGHVRARLVFTEADAIFCL